MLGKPLKTIALDTELWRRSIIAVWALAENFRNHPETLPLLKTIAVEGKSEWVSDAVVSALATNLGTHSEIIALESPTRSTYIYRGVIIPAQYGQTPLSQWQPSWLLTETNAEVRRALIQGTGYEKICLELKAIALDTYREYSLMRIHIPRIPDDEPILLLKMTCPSTSHIHVLRVPPHMKSAREAIRWVNWGIDPEEWVIET